MLIKRLVHQIYDAAQPGHVFDLSGHDVARSRPLLFCEPDGVAVGLFLPLLRSCSWALIKRTFFVPLLYLSICCPANDYSHEQTPKKHNQLDRMEVSFSGIQ